MVSGALALMKQYFMAGTNCGAGDLCGLGSHELVARILATADKRGIYADSSVYGAGLLDLKNALTPQGELQLLSGGKRGGFGIASPFAKRTANRPRFRRLYRTRFAGCSHGRI